MTDFRPDEHQLRAVREFCRGSAHDRFWSKVDKSGECWVWTAGLFSNGYGQFKCDGYPIGAHVYSYEESNGPIPAGEVVMHSCDNRRCVRPSHLSAGRQSKNIEDCKQKGRWDQVRGSRVGTAKINEAGAAGIKKMLALGYSQRFIGDYVGLSQAAVSKINSGQSWSTN